MKENRAVLLLKSLHKDELRWLQKFVESPYYNSNKKLVTLYGLLRKEYPVFSPEKTSPEILFKKIFTRKPYDAPTIRLLTHRLANLIEDFLINERFKKDEVIRNKLLIKDLGMRNAYGLFEKKTRKLLDDLEEVPIKDADYYRHRSDLHLQYYGHPATNRHSKNSEDLHEGMTNLDTYFTLNKLRLATAIQARKNTLAEHLEIPYMSAVSEHVDGNQILARLYLQVLALQESPEDIEVYKNLKSTFIENIKQFSFEDRRLVLNVLLNFCTRKSNKGVLSFMNDSFELYRLGLEKNFLLFNNELTMITYTNIVTLASTNKEFDWAEKFMENYTGYLDIQVRMETRAFCVGLIQFRKKEFEAAYNTLQSININVNLIQRSVKSLMVRIPIELYLRDKSYFELANSQLNTFEKYIRNNFKEAPLALKAYLNFIKFSRKFLKVKSIGYSTGPIIEKVKMSQNIALKGWLLEKLEDAKGA